MFRSLHFTYMVKIPGVLHVGAAEGRWIRDLQVAGSNLIWSAFTQHRSTQPCIPPGSLNRVPASAGGKVGIHTSARWQVTLCDPIWHVSFPQRWRAKLMLTAIHCLLCFLTITVLSLIHRLTMAQFHQSYLYQLVWPPCCRARKCKHFAALTVGSSIWRLRWAFLINQLISFLLASLHIV